MKTLFVGPYYGKDGWSNASKEYIRALRLSKLDVVTRPVFFNQHVSHNEFDDLEKKSHKSYDIIIQHCLPNMMRRYGGVHNVGLAFFETHNLNLTPWIKNLNLLDEVVVSSECEKNILEQSGVNVKITVIPIPVDINKYKKIHLYDGIRQEDNKFKFYFIGEYITRKNLMCALKAFDYEFTKSDDAIFIIKSNRINTPPEQTLINIKEDIKNSLSKRKKRVHSYIITSFLSNENLMGLHQKCDCFVMPSCGEACCMPAFDAMCFGKTPIVNKNTSMSEYVIDKKTGFTVDSIRCPAFAEDRPLDYLYDGNDEWYEVNVIDLAKKMREAYNLTIKEKMRMKLDSLKIAEKYSYENISKKINEKFC